MVDNTLLVSVLWGFFACNINRINILVWNLWSIIIKILEILLLPVMSNIFFQRFSWLPHLGFPPFLSDVLDIVINFLLGSLLSVSSKIYLFPFFVLVFFSFFFPFFSGFWEFFPLNCRAIISAGLTPLYGLFNVLQFSKYSKKMASKW